MAEFDTERSRSIGYAVEDQIEALFNGEDTTFDYQPGDLN